MPISVSDVRHFSLLHVEVHRDYFKDTADTDGLIVPSPGYICVWNTGRVINDGKL